MHTFKLLPVLFFSSSLLLRAQTTVPPAPPGEKIIALDAFVVSSGQDSKTAFDLAQGTSILTGHDLLLRQQGTLGETLNETPGVSSTYYGPGASRPLIRGLGGDRIRVLNNSVGALDASNISPDHNTALEPLFASRIEVLRGPSTLLYGSSAVGGVVNVIDNTIPSTAPTVPITGTLEARGGGAADERTGVIAVTAGNRNFALQVDGLRQESSDVSIPGVARIDADAPPNQPVGTVPNSDIRSNSLSVGATVFTPTSHLGAAVSSYSTLYGVPTDEPISINLHQRRVDLQGETTTPFGIFTGVRARFGLGDYEHSEVADRTVVNTTFKNHAWEGRLELPNVLSENVSGTFGFQAARSDFSAVGEEVVTPPSITTSQALFALEEWKLGSWNLQAGGRLEQQSITLGAVDPALPAVPGYSATSGEKRKDTGASGSVGAVYYPAKDWSVGLNLAYTERLPTAQERYSNGPHGGTGAYEIGTSDLGHEHSVGMDLSIRHRVGFVTGSVSVFVNRFQGYIFEQEQPLGLIPGANNPDGLTPYQFVAKDAEFRGGEVELTFHLVDGEVRHLHLDLTSDYVRAQQTTDDEPLPRIPPFRFGAALRYEDGRLSFGVGTRSVMRQDRVADAETPTAGYTLLSADVTYVLPAGRVSYEFFARGNNLTNQEARAHTSFLKDFVPLPGRGVTAGVRMHF